MPEQITDDPNTPLDGNWYDTVAPESDDNTSLREQLAGFDDAGAFFTSHNELANKDWRKDVAGDDEEYFKELQRFSTPVDYGKSHREAQHTIRSGKLKDDLPASDADEETVKAYREANDIPLEAADYLTSLPEGLVLGEDDVPIAEVFMSALHGVHAPPAYAHALIGAYTEFQEQQQDAENALDTEQAKEATDALRDTWGKDYRANINLVGAFMENTFGKEVKEQFLNGRFADRRAFMNDPKILEGIAAVQRKLDPVTQIIPPDGDAAQTLNDEIAEIEKFMSEHRTAYNKDENKQARLRQLYDIRLKHEEAA